MSILVALAAAAGVVGTLLWRLGAASSAVRETAEAVSSLHGLVRRWNWQRLATRSPLADVTDPKEAAAAMLVAVADNHFKACFVDAPAR